MRAAAFVALVLLAPLAAGCLSDDGVPTAAPPLATGNGTPSGKPAPPPLELEECRRTRWPVQEDYECLGMFEGSTDAPPHFLTTDWIDVSRIAAVSRFRSGAGHDYADDFERCRSLKHYFVSVIPGGRDANPEDEPIRIVAPAAGTIMAIRDEHAAYGKQVQLAPDAVPGALVLLFHVNVTDGLAPGRHVAAGDLLGHVVPDHGTDIAVLLMTREGRRAVSYFDVLTGAAFAPYASQGLAPAELVIPQADRDATPLTCEGERFVPTEFREEDWVRFRYT